MTDAIAAPHPITTAAVAAIAVRRRCPLIVLLPCRGNRRQTSVIGHADTEIGGSPGREAWSPGRRAREPPQGRRPGTGNASGCGDLAWQVFPCGPLWERFHLCLSLNGRGRNWQLVRPTGGRPGG